MLLANVVNKRLKINIVFKIKSQTFDNNKSLINIYKKI